VGRLVDRQAEEKHDVVGDPERDAIRRDFEQKRGTPKDGDPTTPPLGSPEIGLDRLHELGVEVESLVQRLVDQHRIDVFVHVREAVSQARGGSGA